MASEKTWIEATIIRHKSGDPTAYSSAPISLIFSCFKIFPNLKLAVKEGVLFDWPINDLLLEAGKKARADIPFQCYYNFFAINLVLHNLWPPYIPESP